MSRTPDGKYSRNQARGQEQMILEQYPRYRTADGGWGYVYLLKAQNGLYKIGQTVYLAERIQRHRRKWKGPFNFTIVTILHSPQCERLEKFLHRKFDAKRETHAISWVSSWFALSDDDVAYIKSLGGAS